jgi:GH24 family phage-related lysozyme (muramidase)
MREFSAPAREKLTEPWEERVLFVYDDKVARRRINGKMQYPEWDGGAVRGTLTIGFGHTDAAGAPKIVQGMRITDEECDQILSDDIEPCVRAVNRLLKVEVTQHQFDMLVDTWFNCPVAAVAAIKLYNSGNGRSVPAKLMQYTFSKGEHMEGLVHRRAAEIAWGNTPDEVEGPAAPNPEAVFSPKAERNPPPMSMASSKSGAAALTSATGALAIAANAANEALEPIKQVKGSLADLGVFDHLDLLVHNPTVVICAAVAGLAAFIWFDRRNKLVNAHV